MANSIVNQLLHDPVIQLKHYAPTHQGHLYTEILQKLFNLDVPGQKILEGQTGQPQSGDLQAERAAAGHGQAGQSHTG